MRVFIISLQQSIDRRERIRKQLLEQGVPFSFFDGINLHTDRNHYFHHCDEASFLLNTGRTPSVGELGCFASHLMLWRTCRLLNEPVVILEDDAGLSSDFGATLPFVQRHIGELGFVRLQRNKKRGRRAVIEQQQRRIEYCSRYPHGSNAYAISPVVADAFIESSKVFRAPVDVFIKRFWRHRQPLFTLSPAIARSSVASATSTIAGRERIRPSLPVALRRWWRKRQDFMGRLYFNRQWLRSRKGRLTQRESQNAQLAVFKSDS